MPQIVCYRVEISGGYVCPMFCQDTSAEINLTPSPSPIGEGSEEWLIDDLFAQVRLIAGRPFVSVCITHQNDQ